MTRKLAKWASKRGQTAEFRPSNAGGGKSFQLRRNLGTIAMNLKAIWEMSDKYIEDAVGVERIQDPIAAVDHQGRGFPDGQQAGHVIDVRIGQDYAGNRAVALAVPGMERGILIDLLA